MVFERLLGSIEGGDVLDVGCGEGQFTEILIKSLKSFKTLTGVDVDRDPLEGARKSFPGPEFRFLEIPSNRLPFDAESFDLVAISKALHHIENPRLTLEEMHRVLKAGGCFLINEMHRDGLSHSQESHVLYHHLRSDIDNILGISHNHTLHRMDLISLAEGLGLKDRVIAEFIPDDGNARDPEKIEEFGRKLDYWLPFIEGHPARDEIAGRIHSLKERFREHGVSRPPQLLILGKK
jgi:SAM-dependent methyltransferase